MKTKQDIKGIAYKNQDIKGRVYKNLIKYAVENNDVVAFTYRPDQHKEATNKVIDIILRESSFSKDDIINDYSDKFIYEIFEKFKDNDDIFRKCYKQNFDKFTDYDSYVDFMKDNKSKNWFIEEYSRYGIKLSFDNMTHIEYKQFFKYNARLDIIWNDISCLFYEHNVENFIKKHKEEIIYEEKIISNDMSENEMVTSVCYFFKLSDSMKREILNNNSIYSWCFPFYIEDIEFYRDGYCWLLSVAHENIFEIFCETRKEFKYLKKIGVEFESKKFIPISKDDVLFKNYKFYKKAEFYDK